MEEVVVKEARVPTTPKKEQEADQPFSPIQGGHLLKRQGEKFTTEVGLWVHQDMMDDEMETLTDLSKIRMAVLRIKW